MANTQRSTASLLALFADNTSNAITAQDARDLIVSAVVFRGAWSSSEAYYAGNIVTRSGTLYFAVVGTTADDPATDGAVNWWPLGPGGTSGSVGSAPPAPAATTRLLWLDATQLTGVAAGGGVSSWLDAGGNGNGVAQTTTAQQPTYQTGVVNGKPVVRFDATDDGMYGGPTIPDGTDYALFMVFRPAEVPSGNGRALQNAPAADGTNALWVGTASAAFTADGNGQPADDGSATYAAGTAYCITVIGRSADGYGMHLLVNGVDHTSHSGNYGRPIAVALGCAGAVSDEPSGGDVAEVILYEGTVSDSQRAAVESYLSGKWSLGF